MSLKDRQREIAKEESTKNQIPDGDYVVRMKDWHFGKAKSGADMYTLTWKILEAGDHKGKERKTFYVIGQSWSFGALLDLVEAMGADLTQLDKPSELDEVFEMVEDAKMPKAVMKIENIEGKKFPKITLSDVEEVLVPVKAKTTAKKTSAKKTADVEDEADEDTIVSPE